MLNAIYKKMPTSIQNFILSAYGYYIYNQRYGGNFQKLKNNFKMNESLTSIEIEELQNKLLQNIIRHSYNNVPYYNKLFKSLNLTSDDIKTKKDLNKLPILTKEMIKNNPDEFIATNIKRRKLIEYPTGGSSGSPLIMYTTKEEIRYNFAISERRLKEWFDVKTGDKLATFLGRHIIDDNIYKPPFWRKNKAYNQTLYSIYHMNEQNMIYYIENLKKEKPKVIIGYVTPIYNLSKFILNNGIEPLKVQAILTSSETLYDWQKDSIAEAFQCKVCNGYSQAEGVSFISECKCGKLHVQPEFGLAEFLPVNGTNLYEIIGTTFFNYSMPLIRYKTNDLVELSKEQECECGRNFNPLLDKIIGRNESVIKTPDGRLINSASISLIFKYFIQIKEAQLIQNKINELDVKLVVSKPLIQKEEKNFINLLKEKVGNIFEININYVESIPKTIGGKHRFIVSNLEEDNE